MSYGALGGPNRKADDEDEHGCADKTDVEQVMPYEPRAEHSRQGQEHAEDPQHESTDFEFHRVNP